MKSLFLILFFAHSVVHAAELTVNWERATKNTDGSTLIDLTGHEIHYGSTTSLGTVVSVSGADTRTYKVTGLNSGVTYYFAMRSVATSGKSSLTNLATGVAISTEVLSVSAVTAYKQTQSVNGYTMTPIGTIAIGTACVEGKSVDGYNLLPDRNAVVMNSPRAIRPTSAFAKCALQ